MEARISQLETQLEAVGTRVSTVGSRVNLNIAIGIIGILLAVLKLLFPIPLAPFVPSPASANTNTIRGGDTPTAPETPTARDYSPPEK